MLRFLMAAAFAMMASTALSHSALEATSPAEGAVLSVAPSELTFSFTRGLRMTNISWTLADTDQGQLDLTGKTTFETQFTLPFEAAGSGTYQINWRGLSDDGHPQSGSIRFTVK